VSKEDLEAAALVGGAVAFVVALWQYRIAQQWKRAEWVAAEMRAFLEDPWVRVTCTLIDCGAWKGRLPPDAEAEVLVSDDEIKVALVHHRQREDGFTPKEALIRDAFDRFLDGMELFAAHVRSGLVLAKDFAPYLSYWAFHIHRARAGDPKVDRLVQLRAYASEYGYSGALALLEELAGHHAVVARRPTTR
jgi:hypothetical protein